MNRIKRFCGWGQGVIKPTYPSIPKNIGELNTMEIGVGDDVANIVWFDDTHIHHITFNMDSGANSTWSSTKRGS